MEKRLKQNLLVTAFGVTLFAVLMNFSSVLTFARKVIGIILPIIVGGILALFVNVPVNGVEKRLKKLFQNAKKKPSDKLLHIFSFIITLILILFVLFAVLSLLIPEVVHSLQRLYAQIEDSIPNWLDYLNKHNVDVHWLEELLADIDMEQVTEHISSGIDLILENAVNALSSTVNMIITGAFALIISIYMTLGKERVCTHARKMVCAYLKPAWAKGILHFSRTFAKSFSNFLTGQCSEAVILGILMFMAFTIFRLPYGSLAGVLTAFCSIIPYVGAFISCSVSVFLVLLIEPTLAIRCLVVYLAVQFIENQFIYPRVVGNSVGLPPLYTLIAAMIGGKLFGIIGIIFFIPLAAAVIEIVKEDANQRLNRWENRAI